MDIATMYLALFKTFLGHFNKVSLLGLQKIGNKSNKNDQNVNNSKE